jgi:hypothetical protein
MEKTVPHYSGQHLILILLPGRPDGDILYQFLRLVLQDDLAFAIEDLVEEFPLRRSLRRRVLTNWAIEMVATQLTATHIQ